MCICWYVTEITLSDIYSEIPELIVSNNWYRNGLVAWHITW